MEIDQLTRSDIAKILRKEAAHQCDIARSWYDQGSITQGDAAMNNAAALMRIAADYERRDEAKINRGPHHD